MKAYTDIEQSKKLAEILPLESADMYYPYVLPKSDRIKHNPETSNPVNALKWYNIGYTTFGREPITLDEYCVPCWSLTALLEVTPKQLSRYTLTFYWCDGSWCCSYIDDGSEIKETSSANNPVDATVEMIVKLKEKDLL